MDHTDLSVTRFAQSRSDTYYERTPSLTSYELVV